MKAEVNVNELTDVDVKYVSLVKRGANRIPFRIVKSEDGEKKMNIDLSSLFKSEPLAPVVAYIAVSDNADQGVAEARIEAAGFSIEKAEEVDGGILYHQEEPKNSNISILKFDESCAAAIAHVDLKKAFNGYDFSGTSFDEVMETEGVMPSIRMAKEVLGNTMYNIMYKSEDPKEMSSMLTKAINEFRDYVVGIAKTVPSEAFKMDDPEVLEKAGGNGMGEGVPGGSQDKRKVMDGNAVNKMPGKTKKMPGDDDDDDMKKMPGKAKKMPGKYKKMPGKTKKMPGEDDEDGMKKMPGKYKKMPGKAKKEDEEYFEEDEEYYEEESEASQELSEAMQPVTEMLEKMADRMEKMESGMSVLKTKVEETTLLAKSTDETIGNMVPNSDEGGDVQKRKYQQVEKSEGIGPIDTAFMSVN